MFNINDQCQQIYEQGLLNRGFQQSKEGRGSSVQCPSSSVHFSNNSILFSNIVLCAMFSIRVAGFHAFAHCLWNPRGENQDSNGHRPIRDSLAHCYAMYISLFSGCSNIDNNLLGALRDILLRKYCFSFGFCPNYLTLASPPIWTACTTFSRCRNSRFERQFRTKITIRTICWA